MKKTKVKSLFLSDIHLGFRGSQAETLLNDVLKKYEYENLFLVGDIIDLWAMQTKMHFPIAHSNVVRYVLKLAKNGVNVVYIPGNHDEMIRDYCGESFANIQIVEEYVHTIGDKKFLLLHGDKFDLITQNIRWLAFFGSWLYDVSLSISHRIQTIRRLLGFKTYWSFSRMMKYKVKSAVKYIDNFSAAVSAEAKQRKVDGIIAGHIHHPEITEIDGIVYCNCGDFVESCSFLVETNDDEIELIGYDANKQSFEKIDQIGIGKNESK
jgi:UDP-2,3-diacylglucosamine pyrophosphatase LpxH